MQLVFSTSNRHFLELYEPQVIFLSDIYLAEGEAAVKEFLEDQGLTIEDLKENGIKAMKNKITVPKGTKATIISMNSGDDGRTELEINGLYVQCYLTFEADEAVMEVTPKDPELERAFGKYKRYIPKKQDNVTLYGYDLLEIIEAFTIYYNNLGKVEAFEMIKVTPKDKIDSIMQFYNKYLETAKIDEAM